MQLKKNRFSRYILWNSKIKVLIKNIFLWISNLILWILNFILWISNFILWISNVILWISNFKCILLISNIIFEFQTLIFEFQTLFFIFQTLIFEFQTLFFEFPTLFFSWIQKLKLSQELPPAVLYTQIVRTHQISAKIHKSEAVYFIISNDISGICSWYITLVWTHSKFTFTHVCKSTHVQICTRKQIFAVWMGLKLLSPNWGYITFFLIEIAATWLMSKMWWSVKF